MKMTAASRKYLNNQKKNSQSRIHGLAAFYDNKNTTLKQFGYGEVGGHK